jgi:hypothetical protein
VSRQAVAYVERLSITDRDAKRMFLLLAKRTTTRADPYRPEDIPDVMGLELSDANIHELAAHTGTSAEEFRQQLRGLKQHVRMDVLEHPDGVWEIVYGPMYERLSVPRPPEPDLTQGGPHPFWMPGWEKFSTWGYETGPGGHRHLYAQLNLNIDGPDAQPRIWIAPPRYVVQSIDELADAIAKAIAPYGPVPPPASEIKRWLTRPPQSL